MRDSLPHSPHEKECGILNLDKSSGPGTHWTCWYKTKLICYYFDSFGLPPPIEFEKYIKFDLLWSTYKVQDESDVICGHLCLQLLYDLVVEDQEFHSVALNLFSSSKNDRSKYIRKWSNK